MYFLHFSMRIDIDLWIPLFHASYSISHSDLAQISLVRKVGTGRRQIETSWRSWAESESQLNGERIELSCAFDSIIYHALNRYNLYCNLSLGLILIQYTFRFIGRCIKRMFAIKDM